jgi:DNA-directed RNA polymerase beta subunit
MQMLNPNAKIIEPQGVRLRDPEDFATLREDIYQDTIKAVEKSFPQKYGNVVMRVSNLEYVDPPTFSKKHEKEALAKDQFLGRKLKGKVSLFDLDGNVLDEKETTLMRVPYLTDRGTFIHGGSDYGSLMQSRLIPGVYTRRQENGNLETQVNTRPGTGSSFRIGLESETGQYSLKIKNSNLHLYSLMKDMGVDEEELKNTWGEELYHVNASKYDPTAINRAYEKIVPAFQKRNAGENPDKAAMLRDFFEKAQVHERVTKRNLPLKFDLEKRAEFIAKEVVNEAMLPPFAPAYDSHTCLDYYLMDKPEVEEMLKSASEEEALVPSQLKWIAWYHNYESGNTSPVDEENKLAWRKAAAHFAKLDKSPEALINAAAWGIDATAGLDPEIAESLKLEAYYTIEENRADAELLKQAAFSGSKFMEILNEMKNE